MIINTNKYIVSGLLGIALSASLTSCGDDFLDKNPKLSVTEHDIYASEQLIDATMTGVFTRFKNSSFAGGNISFIFDNRSDDLVNTGNNTLAHSDTYNFTVESDLCPAGSEVYETVKGLNVGDRIVTTGANNVTEGQKVIFPEEVKSDK